ncbi:tRNA (5-methylaminomethyl-2-thiouridine)(34)-methyltransferase MnmD [Candidatus Woesearchaeota archaeon]|nr:tRNA (5-methylaminomethyl-2-thiouridine)(34)-methyltransferase MnmD [Candidatus Woesearchaeota archaeon]
MDAMVKHVTEDGSVTFISKKYDEAYHSLTGAREEAFKKYAEPCKIKELAKKGNISILDFCFGLGYNTAAALDVALKENPNCKITVVALEIDEEILAQIDKLTPEIDHYDIIKKLSRQEGKIKEIKETSENKNIHIKLLVGDARETLDLIQEKFDAVFFDPFSPKKCPELWTEEIFAKVNKLMNKDAILATYSCAGEVRRNMKEAGFKVVDGPIVRRWSPGTLAIKV